MYAKEKALLIKVLVCCWLGLMVASCSDIQWEWITFKHKIEAAHSEKKHKKEISKMEKSTAKCLKKKQKQIQNIKGENFPHDVGEAIALYDFEIARMYLDCYPIADESIYKETEVRSAVNKRISRAEISYLVLNCTPPEIEKARAIATENNLLDIFSDVCNSYVYRLLENKDYEKVLDFISVSDMPSVLDYYEFSEPCITENEFEKAWRSFSVNEKSTYYSFNNQIHSFYLYNEEALRINKILNVVFNEAIRMHRNDLAEDCVRAYKPIVDVKKRKISDKDCGTDYVYVLKLVDKPKQEAQKKLKAAGIKL